MRHHWTLPVFGSSAQIGALPTGTYSVSGEPTARSASDGAAKNRQAAWGLAQTAQTLRELVAQYQLPAEIERKAA